jgi:hypothetical protein
MPTPPAGSSSWQACRQALRRACIGSLAQHIPQLAHPANLAGQAAVPHRAVAALHVCAVPLALPGCRPLSAGGLRVCTGGGLLHRGVAECLHVNPASGAIFLAPYNWAASVQAVNVLLLPCTQRRPGKRQPLLVRPPGNPASHVRQHQQHQQHQQQPQSHTLARLAHPPLGWREKKRRASPLRGLTPTPLAPHSL